MICERCGCVFCLDDDIFPGQVSRRYCGKTCRKHSSPSYSHSSQERDRKRHQLAVCAARGKTKYPAERDAIGGAAKFERLHGDRLYPYECPCGQWHLTGQPTEWHGLKATLMRAVAG